MTISISRSCAFVREDSLHAVTFDAPPPYSFGFRPLPSGVDVDLSIDTSAPLCRHRNSSVPSDTSFSALRQGGQFPATMASADFCRPVPTPLDAGSTRQIDRSPRVMHVTFLPYTRRIYRPTLPDGYRALKIMAFSPGWTCLVCGFCSSGRDFACGFLQIPPRDGYPCLSASGSHHQGPQGTFTPESSTDYHSQSSGADAPRAMRTHEKPSICRSGAFLKLRYFLGTVRMSIPGVGLMPNIERDVSEWGLYLAEASIINPVCS